MAHSKGWIGCDLDGTLAKYEGWISPQHIGQPIPAMVERVKDWLSQGIEVRIFTARVYAPAWNVARAEEADMATTAIQAWCLKHIGQMLPVTCTKDYAMVNLYDDRCQQVEPNTGRLIVEQLPYSWLIASTSNQENFADVLFYFYFDANGLPAWTTERSEGLHLSRPEDAEALKSWISKWHDRPVFRHKKLTY